MAKNNPRENKAKQAKLAQAAQGMPVSDAPNTSDSVANQVAGQLADQLAGQVTDHGVSAAQNGLSGSLEKQSKSAASSKRSSRRTKGNRPSVKGSKVVQPGLSGTMSDDPFDEASDITPDAASGSDSATGKITTEVVDSSAESGADPAESSVIDADGALELDGVATPISEDELDAQQPDEGYVSMLDKGSRESAEDKRERSRKLGKVIKWIVIVLVLLMVVAAIAAVIAFSTFRWHTHDDAADIQGVWQVEGSDSTITITDETITLTDDVAYKYVLDDDAKTISFMFGNLRGGGHYRFSLDRDQLAIVDGDFDWSDSLMSDIPWTADAVMDLLQNDHQLSPGRGEDTTTLSRVE